MLNWESLKTDVLDGEMNLCQMLSAKSEGLLEVNRDFCTTQMVQIHPSAGADVLEISNLSYYLSGGLSRRTRAEMRLVICTILVYNGDKEVDAMTLVERITEETRTMPIQHQQQVLDFVQFLKQKEKQQFIAEVEEIINENLPALKELAK